MGSASVEMSRAECAHLGAALIRRGRKALGEKFLASAVRKGGKTVSKKMQKSDAGFLARVVAEMPLSILGDWSAEARAALEGRLRRASLGRLGRPPKSGATPRWILEMTDATCSLTQNWQRQGRRRTILTGKRGTPQEAAASVLGIDVRHLRRRLHELRVRRTML